MMTKDEIIRIVTKKLKKDKKCRFMYKKRESIGREVIYEDVERTMYLEKIYPHFVLFRSAKGLLEAFLWIDVYKAMFGGVINDYDEG